MTAPADRRLITEARLFQGGLIKDSLLPAELGLSTPEVAEIISETSFIHEGVTMTPNAEDDAVIFTSVEAAAGPAAASFLTQVASSITQVTILALNNARKGATIFNDSASLFYLSLGDTASTTVFTLRMPPDGYFEVPFEYTGVITGLWATASGFARVTEFE